MIGKLISWQVVLYRLVKNISTVMKHQITVLKAWRYPQLPVIAFIQF